MHNPVIVRVVFIAAGVVGLLFGLFFLLGAAQAIQSYDLGAPTVPALLFARSTGAALISLGVINLLASFDRGSTALRALAIGNVLIHILSIGVDFSQPYARNAGVWVSVAIHVVFIAAFGYCLVHWREMTGQRPM
jgi:hypothetical protein